MSTQKTNRQLPSTSGIDILSPFSGDQRHGHSKPELQEYLLIEQDRQHADLFRKNAEGLWVLHPFRPGDIIQLKSLNQNISLTLLYEDVDLNKVIN